MRDPTGAARLSQAIEYMRRVTGRPRLECQQLQLLLTLLGHEDGVAMQDLAKELGADPSFVSRNTQAFGTKSKGKELIAQRIDPENPKFRLVYLTPAGRDAVNTAVAVCGGEKPMPRVAKVSDPRAYV